MSRHHRKSARNNWPKPKRVGELQAETPPMHFTSEEPNDNATRLTLHLERLPPGLAKSITQTEKAKSSSFPKQDDIFVA